MRIKSQVLALLLASAVLSPLPAVAAEFTIVSIKALTGPLAFVGVPEANAAIMAADELNASNYFGTGNSLKLISQDDQNDRALYVNPSQDFVMGVRLGFGTFQVMYSLIKATLFGAAIALVCSYEGFVTEAGAEGVGRSTAKAVVITSVSILILDTLTAAILAPYLQT